jgi:lysophospholipase L1-like esterase
MNITMKRLLKIFACLLLAGSLVLQPAIASALSATQKQVIDSSIYYYNVAAGCSPAAPINTPTNKNIYLLGDSLLEGSYYTTGELRKDLKTNNWDAEADASAGRSITAPGSDPTNHRQGHEQSGLDAIDTDADIIKGAGAIVVELGTNTSGSANQFEDQMTKVIQKIKGLNKNAQIYWVNIVSTSNPIYSNYNNTIDKVAKDQKIAVIDAKSRNIQLGADKTHPTADGYKDYSDVISNIVGVPGTNSNPAAATGNGACCDTSASGDFSGGNNIEIAFNYFVSNGLTPVQSAGIVGNMMLESGVQPERLEGTASGVKTPAESYPGSGGWGIVQWTPGSKFIDKIKPTSNANKLEVQLDFVWNQLTGKGPLPETIALKDIKKTTTLRDAVLAWQGNQKVGGPYYGFERPGDEQGSVGQRTTYATQVLKKYGGNAGGSTSTTSENCADQASGSSDISAYKNPFRDIKNLVRKRIDQGVDYGGSGPIYALGKGKVLNLTNDGWPGGTFIVYQLSEGPAKGKYVYFAENCKPIKVAIGDQVDSDTVLCTMIDARPHIEIGWADGSALGQAKAASVWVNHDSTAYYTAYGENFSQLLQKLHAPPGTIAPGATKLGSLPAGWPEWK